MNVPSSIDATGATNVLHDLQTFFNTVPDYTTVVFPAGAKYDIEGSLILMKRTNLTLVGNGATLLTRTDGYGQTPQPGAGLLVAPAAPQRRDLNDNGLLITGLHINGSNRPGGPHTYIAAIEAQHGFDIEHSNRVTLRGNTIEHVHGDFVNITSNSTQIEVINNTMSYSGRQGISVTSANGVLLLHNSLFAVGRSAFDLEPDTGLFRPGARHDRRQHRPMDKRGFPSPPSASEGLSTTSRS